MVKITVKPLTILIIFILLGGPVQAYGQVDDWEFSFTCELDQFHQEITVGFNQGASTGFDTDYDQVTPPQPPMGLYIYLEHPDEVSFLQKLSKSIVGHQENYEWSLVIRTIGVDGPVVIGWGQTPDDVEITVHEGTDIIPIQDGETIIQVSQGEEHRLTINARKKGPDQPTEEESTELEETEPEEDDPETPDEEENINEPELNQTTETPNNVTEPAKTPGTPSEDTASKQVEIIGIEYAPINPQPNQEITLTVTLRNPDEQVQDFILTISVDSIYAQTRTGSLAPGQEITVSYMFEVTEKGEHTVKVNDEYVKINVGSAPTTIDFPIIPVLIGVVLFVYVSRRFA